MASCRVRNKTETGGINRDCGDGTFDIDYDDGESETRVAEDMIRLVGADVRKSMERKPRIEEGSKVEANYRGKGKRSAARIKRDRGAGTLDINYDDGEPETRVAEGMIRLAGAMGRSC